MTSDERLIGAVQLTDVVTEITFEPYDGYTLPGRSPSLAQDPPPAGTRGENSERGSGAGTEPTHFPPKPFEEA